MKEEALKLADEVLNINYLVTRQAVASILRRLVEQQEKYIKVLEEIANDYPELSHDKARMQNLDHIKWAKEVLK